MMIINLILLMIAIGSVAFFILYHVYIGHRFASQNVRFVEISEAQAMAANCGDFKHQHHEPYEDDVVMWDDLMAMQDKVINNGDVPKVIKREQHKYVPVPSEINEHNFNDYQLVMAVGDSMKHKGIQNHDMIWVDKYPRMPFKKNDVVLIVRESKDGIEFKVRELMEKISASEWETCCGGSTSRNIHDEKYFRGKIVLPS